MRQADLHGNDRSFSLLFVCTANQCRSPLAEALALRQLERRGIDGRVGSAGVAALDDCPASDGTLIAARRERLDLSNHRSRAVTHELVASSTLILTMERNHVIDLVNDFGADLGRTFTLPELAEISRLRTNRRADGTLSDWLTWVASKRAPIGVLHAPLLEIDDPTGRALRHYRTTIRRIDTGLSAIFDAVTGIAGTDR